MPIAKSAKKSTKTAIMDAAELMMAEHGVEGATVRAIVGKAGANTAAIHYHFSSREGLVQAILGRRGDQLSRRRLEMINEFDRSDCAPTPTDIVSFLVDPMIELLERKGEAGRRHMRFLSRLQFDRRSQPEGSGLHIQEERKYYPEIRERLIDLAEQACPELSDVERRQRLAMTIDTMLQSLANADFMASEWTGDTRHDELFGYAENLKAFLAAGLGAPSTVQTHPPENLERIRD